MRRLVRKLIKVSLIALALSACHHDNPLKVNPTKQSAEFILNASANTEKRLKLPIHHDSYGFVYLECMEPKKSRDLDCNDLYEGMVAFAKENHYPKFKKLKVSDLTDKKVFNTLADDYAEFAATHRPKFHTKGR